MNDSFVEKISNVVISSIRNSLPEDYWKRPHLVYGAGSVASDFLTYANSLSIDSVVSMDAPRKIDGSLFVSEPLSSISNYSEPFIFIASSFYEEIVLSLPDGFEEGRDYISVFGLTAAYISMMPAKSISDSLDWLSNSELDYVIMRDSSPTGGDVDLLINPDDLDSIFNSSKFIIGATSINRFDFFWSKPLGLPNEINRLLPYQSELLLKNYIIDNRGLKLLNPRFQALSLFHHICYFKSNAASPEGLFSKDSKYGVRITDAYANILNEEPRYYLTDLLKTLEKYNFSVPIDFSRYLIESFYHSGEPSMALVKNFSVCNSKKQDMILVIREWVLINIQNWVETITNFMERDGFIYLSHTILNNSEVNYIESNFRGGNWYEDKEAISGGRPAAVIRFIDSNVTDKDFYADIQCRSGLSNRRWGDIKNNLRIELCSNFHSINSIHGTDDQLESNQYLKFLKGKL